MNRHKFLALAIILGVSTIVMGSCREPSEPREESEKFYEEVPAWRMPNLVVTEMELEPRRANPGERVIVMIEVTNHGAGPSEPARLHFSVDGVLAETVEVAALEPGEIIHKRIAWIAESSGLHRMVSEIVPASGQVDGDALDNRVNKRIWVSGGGIQMADIEMELVPAEDVRETAGNFTLVSYNPSFVVLESVEALIWLDDERYGRIEIGPVEPGESQETAIQLQNLPIGDHILSLQVEWPDIFYDRDIRTVTSWHIGIPGPEQLAHVEMPGTWSSIGPRILVKAQPDGSQGRIDHLAIDPKNSNILYASAVRGGLWKSLDAGKSWSELTDDLSKKYGVSGDASPLSGGAIAIDPGDSTILYYGTGSSRYSGGLGIFKSIDGGKTWHQIATESITKGVSEIYVERTASGVIVYAATDKGLLRYANSNPKKISLSTSDWTTLWGGKIEDMAVDPNDVGRVYIADIGATRTKPDGKTAQVMKGLYRCSNADTATGTASCKALTAGLPAMNTNSSIRIDLFRDDPKVIYASVVRVKAFDASAPRLAIYRSGNYGDTWILKKSFGDKEPNGNSLYNPHIRVHPSNSSKIWFGGVNLFEIDFDDSQPKAVAIFPPHDDQHGMVFDPKDDNLYYAVGDGGVWRCKVVSGVDKCTHRNTDLRVMELYDIDIAENNPALIMGGTQDNGTIVYTGSLDWNKAGQPRGGDGTYTPMSLSNQNVVISQNQHMHSTSISTSGPQGPWIAGLANGASLPQSVKDLYVREAYLTFHPNNPDLVATIGDQVYATTNATDFKMDGNVRRSTAIWDGRGPGPAGSPGASNVKGTITRVLFQPDTYHWYAATSKGQVWRSNHGLKGTWSLVWEQLDNAPIIDMAFAPTDKDVLYVLFSGGDIYRRILRLQGLSSGVTGTPMGNNFPANRHPRVISGDGYDSDKVYVGTDKGVFEGDMSRPTYDCWQPYNQGMPLTLINDLVVPTGRLKAGGSSTAIAPERRLFAATRGRGVWTVDTGP